MTVALAHVNGIRLAYESSGEGEPVLLIGGTGMPPAAWQLFQVPALTAGGYRAVALASRGVAPSQAPPPPYSIADLAADSAALIERLALAPCRVVGLSLGGFVAEELARSRPDLVRCVVLIASAGSPTAYVRIKFSAERELFAAAEVPPSHDLVHTLTHVLPQSVLRDDDDTVEHWAALLAGQPQAWTSADGRLGQHHAAWAWLLDEDRRAGWPLIDPPCLVIAFEHDLYFPPRVAREAAAAMPNAICIAVPGATHAGIIEHSDAINQELIRFFADH